MNFILKIERLQRLNKFIDKECTGTPLELAKRLGMKKRTLYEWIDLLRDYGAEIQYDRQRQTYYYIDKKPDIQFSIKILRDDESNTIDGGNFKLNLNDAIFLHAAAVNLIYGKINIYT